MTTQPEIAAGYDLCEQITREQARNFSYGIRLLPSDKRRALSAVYATARRIDDIGDGALPGDQRLAQLDDLQAALHGPDPTDPVLVALADAARRYPLPMTAFDELVDGCRADVDVHRYQTIDELLGYCTAVAGSVGRLSVAVYQPPDLDRCWTLANALGIALQLTNILRDLREDRLMDRVYLPQEDLHRFGCRLEVDADGRLADPAEPFAALVRFEARRAEEWYAEGLRLLPLLDWRSGACTAAMAGIYHRLLHRIVADPERVRGARLSLSTPAKMAAATRALAVRSA